jgi:hypothetical protein
MSEKLKKRNILYSKQSDVITVFFFFSCFAKKYINMKYVLNQTHAVIKTL